MNQHHHSEEESFTLDPPGTIVVVGAGLLGIEAALYGRFLGYDIQILEADCVGSDFVQRASEELPTMPNRFLSTLSVGALQAQRGEDLPPVPPTNFGQWVDEMLAPIAETDLLRGRVLTGLRVTEINQVPDASEAIPPDFRLTAQTADDTFQAFDSEAVILAVGGAAGRILLGFTPPVPYFFSIGANRSENWSTDLRAGWKEITGIYAKLAGRADLDLYRPRRL